MNKKTFFKTSSILWTLVFILLLWVPAGAAQEPEMETEQARSINYYTRHDEVFTGMRTVPTNVGGYDTITITIVMDIGYYYEEGVYAEIAYFVPHSVSAYIASTGPAYVSVESDAYKLEDGKVVVDVVVNGIGYEMKMYLDDWGEPCAALRFK